MDGRTIIPGLFGNAARSTIRLRRAAPCARVSVPDEDMRTPGWLPALCVARAAQHGEEALLLVTPAGTALAFVASTTATAAAAAPTTATGGPIRMSVVPYRPRMPRQVIDAIPPPYGDFCAFRSLMMKSWLAWLATNPPADLVQSEAESTGNAMRQIAELTRGTGT